MDFSTEYLSYPVTNVPKEINFYCSNCEEEWDKKVILRISLEEVKGVWKNKHEFDPRRDICRHCGHSRTYAEKFKKPCIK